MTLHTDRHFEGELQTLQQLLLRMGGLVEQQIARAIEALVERDSDLARDVIDRDREVNQLDIADRRGMPQVDRPPPACGRRSPSRHHRPEDQHRPRAHRRHGGQHLRASARAERRADAEALHRHPAHGQGSSGDGARQPRRVRAAEHGARRGGDRAATTSSTALRIKCIASCCRTWPRIRRRSRGRRESC